MLGLSTIGLFLCGLAAARSDFPDFLMEKEETPSKVDDLSRPFFITTPLDLGELPCKMDIKITERVIGKCVRLGPSSEACVSNSYIEPFHPECPSRR